jgi:hypothetical protein
MIKKALALIVAMDGLTTALWGFGFLRWLRSWLPWPVPPIANWFLRWPEPILRGGAALQALGGWIVFRIV